MLLLPALFSVLAFAQSPAPLVLKPLPAKSVKVGSPFAIRWTAPASDQPQSVGLFLVSESAPNSALQGPLMLKSQRLTTAGQLKWSADQVACAPTDKPRWCDGLLPGRYHIRAVVYKNLDQWLIGQVMGPGPVDVYETKSESFEITADPNFDLISQHFRSAVVSKIVTQFSLFDFSGTEIWPRYVEFTKPEAPANSQVKLLFCSKAQLKLPFKGELRVCERDLDPAKVTITGDISYAPGIETYTLARKRGENQARRTYPKSDMPLTNWMYKAPTLNKAAHWGFVFYVTEARKLILVRVFEKGAPSLEELPLIPGTSASSIDIWRLE